MWLVHQDYNCCAYQEDKSHDENPYRHTSYMKAIVTVGDMTLQRGISGSQQVLSCELCHHGSEYGCSGSRLHRWIK